MPHVTFIHGIANKPPKKKLLQDWTNALDQGGLNLDAYGVSMSMVHWADVMYDKPEKSEGSYEQVEAGLGTEQGDDDDLDWLNEASTHEKAFLEQMRHRLGFDKVSPEEDDYTPPLPPEPSGEKQQSIAFEAVPIPWFIKRRLMKRLLKDVYYYLFNKPWTHATQGDTILVRDYIRDLFINQLKADVETNKQNGGGAHVVVSHSMGTVISYDCLKHVTDCPPITGYMTVGSPLGISEVHDNFERYHHSNAFPSGKLSGQWINVYDRLDPVAFDAHLANDYQQDNLEIIEDQRVRNDGAWRHSSWKYFNQEALCNHLHKLLDL